MQDFSPKRRKLLIGGVAGVATLGILGAASWSGIRNYRAEWIEQVVRGSLPGIDIEPASFKTFIDTMLVGKRLRRPVVKATMFADQFLPWLPAQVSKARDGLVGLERHVLTEFLMGSNFFRVTDPRREPIVYTGPVFACSNPFTHGAGFSLGSTASKHAS